MKLKTILKVGYALTFLVFFSACSNDDDRTANEEEMMEEENKTTGFVSVGFTGSGSAVVKYFEELPTGTIDLSEGNDFAAFQLRSIFDGAIFAPRVDGSSGLSKLVVNSEGDIVEEATIATPSLGRVVVRDAEVGVFQNGSTPNIISVFNPTTFEVTASIDMSEGYVPNDANQRYNNFIFRGDDLFTDIRNDDPAQGNPYFTEYVVQQANLVTNTFVGDTKREGNGFGTIRNSAQFGQGLIDLTGNLYMPDEGNYDGLGIAARLNKIPSGSNEIDPTYTFEPAVTLNPTNVLLPYFDKFKFLENGKAVAVVNKEIPQEVLVIVAAAGGFQNLTSAQQLEVAQIAFSAKSAVWCEIDVVAETVTPITGIPELSAFSLGNVEIFEHDGDIYLPVIDSGVENAYYEYTPSTGTASKAFVMTGVDFPSFFNIENNN